jgi:hypothetical protein
MNQFNFSNGGMPLFSDDLQFLMTEISRFVNCHYGSTKPQILFGCKATGTFVDYGVLIDPSSGELFYHPATTYVGFNGSTWYADYIDIMSDQRTYGDNTTHYVNELRTAIFTTGTTNWTSIFQISHTDAYANRLDYKFKQLLNNELRFDNADIYSEGPHDLALQSIYGLTGNTIINQYGGNLTIGSGSWQSGQTTNIHNAMKHLDHSITNLYSSATLPYTLPAAGYDRIIYAMLYSSSNALVYINMDFKTIAHLTDYGSATIMVPANTSISFGLISGSAGSLVVQEQKFGI